MEAVTARRQTHSTVHSMFHRVAGELRVTFTSLDASGFTLDELEALEGAVLHARRQMVEQGPHRKPAVYHPPAADDSIESRLRQQLEQMHSVPT